MASEHTPEHIHLRPEEAREIAARPARGVLRHYIAASGYNAIAADRDVLAAEVAALRARLREAQARVLAGKALADALREQRRAEDAFMQTGRAEQQTAMGRAMGNTAAALAAWAEAERPDPSPEVEHG